MASQAAVVQAAQGQPASFKAGAATAVGIGGVTPKRRSPRASVMMTDELDGVSQASSVDVGFLEMMHYLLDPEAEHPTLCIQRASLGVNLALSVLILMSVTVFVVKSLPANFKDDAFDSPFYVIEAVCVGIFTVEFAAKVVSAPNLKKLLLDPYSIIDVVSILPFYVDLILLAAGVDGDVNLIFLRVIRLMRIFRMFKLGKYSKPFRMVMLVLINSIDALFLLVFLLFMSVILFSSLMWIAEQSDSHFDNESRQWIRADGRISPFQSIPHTSWWCMCTLTTVGYGEDGQYPITEWGKVVAGMTIVVGLFVMAFPVILISYNYGAMVAEEEAAEDERREQEMQALATKAETGDLNNEELDRLEELQEAADSAPPPTVTAMSGIASSLSLIKTRSAGDESRMSSAHPRRRGPRGSHFGRGIRGRASLAARSPYPPVGTCVGLYRNAARTVRIYFNGNLGSSGAFTHDPLLILSYMGAGGGKRAIASTRSSPRMRGADASPNDTESIDNLRLHADAPEASAQSTQSRRGRLSAARSARLIDLNAKDARDIALYGARVSFDLSLSSPACCEEVANVAGSISAFDSLKVSADGISHRRVASLHIRTQPPLPQGTYFLRETWAQPSESLRIDIVGASPEAVEAFKGDMSSYRLVVTVKLKRLALQGDAERRRSRQQLLQQQSFISARASCGSMLGGDVSVRIARARRKSRRDDVEGGEDMLSDSDDEPVDPRFREDEMVVHIPLVQAFGDRGDVEADPTGPLLRPSPAIYPRTSVESPSSM